MSHVATAPMVIAAEAIPGWMTRPELQWLAAQAAEHQVIVEIGSWKGRSTKVMAMATKGYVVSVDSAVGDGDFELTGDDLHKTLVDNLREEFVDGRVRFVRGESRTAAKEFADGSADMVFIDGAHDHPAPTRDLNAWLPKLMPGGLLSGHDAYHPGVQKAIHGRPNVMHGPDGIWWEVVE